MNHREAKKRKKYKSLQEYYFGIFGIKPKDWSQIRWTKQYMERKHIGADVPEEVKEIIEELEKAVEPNDFGQGVVFAIQTIKGKYGIDDWEQDNERH